MSDPEIIENDRSKEHFAVIPASIVQSDLEAQTIPLNEIWYITEVTTSVPNDVLSYALIKFGSDVIFTAYTDRVLRLSKQLTGDDVKTLTIELKNGTATSTPMGLKYSAVKL